MRMRMTIAGAATALLLCCAAEGQFGPRPPSLSGVWSPVIGSGAAYEMTDSASGKKRAIEIAITGKEDYQGKAGYWMEFNFDAAGRGEQVAKGLYMVSGDQAQVMRMVMRMGTEVVEMDLTMPYTQQTQKPTTIDFRKEYTNVGTETITVPAGTFSCDHFKKHDGTAEAWVSDKVHPFGLVKSVDKSDTMVLVRLITDAKTKLPPPYKKLDLQEMMRQNQRP